MAVDTPAKIAILGAGPIGLEAALYARYLGYEVEVFESWTEVAPAVQAAADLPMISPFGMNTSSLGLGALKTHDDQVEFSAADTIVTYGEWHERYLKPLSETDLLADHIRFATRVSGIGKVELTKLDCPSGELDRGAWDFRLQVCGKDMRIVTADVVLDCCGVRPRRFMGHGEILAPDEFSAAFSDYRILNDIGHGAKMFGRLENSFLGKAILIYGDDLGAARAVLRLDQLRERDPATEITWMTRISRERCPGGPLEITDDDSLPARRNLLRQANELATSGRVRWLPGTWIEAVSDAGPDVVVETSGDHEGRFVFQRIVKQIGYGPSTSFSAELQLDICPITDAPRPFSQYILKRPSPYSVEYPAPDPSALITSEPNYYVLGSKSFGRMPGFLFQHGLRQIRDVFTIIGDRADLDLYATMK